jgi:hypothetical protein
MQAEAMTAANWPPQKERKLQQQQLAVQQLQQKRDTQQQLLAPIMEGSTRIGSKSWSVG